MGKAIIQEFANSTREVHAIAGGSSFGVLTVFLWARYNETFGIMFGVIFVSVVTGIRFYSLLSENLDTESEKGLTSKTTSFVSQLRSEGHYTITSYTLSACIVYVIFSVL
jgi:hypothetical protein